MTNTGNGAGAACGSSVFLLGTKPSPRSTLPRSAKRVLEGRMASMAKWVSAARGNSFCLLDTSPSPRSTLSRSAERH